jgi:hypothetical protein
MIKNESGMNFILDNYSYIMEDDIFYQKMSSKFGTKDVDFIIKRGNKLLLIEAKRSSPQELENYIAEIVVKFIDSLFIFTGIILNRKNTHSSIITQEMNKLNHLKGSIQLVLIIKNADELHLRPIRDLLQKKLRKIIKMYTLEENVIVMNETLARRKKFIQ